MKHFPFLLPFMVALAMIPAGAQPPDLPPAVAEQQVREARAAEWLRAVNEREAQERRTPTGAIEQLARSVSQGALIAAARNVQGAAQSRDLQKLEAALMGSPSPWRLAVTPLFAEAPGPEFEARVLVSLEAAGPLEDEALLEAKTTFVERLTLRRDDAGEWKVVPREALPLPAPLPGAEGIALAQAAEAMARAATSEADGFLNTWARVLASPRSRLLQAVSRASMRNVKQVLLGMMQLAQDHDEAFAVAPEDFRDKVMPYVRSASTLMAPALDEDQEFAYALNPGIANKKLAQVADVARTVAVYEAGPDGKPLFRFEGKAIIGFADGHVARVSPEEAQKLVWKF